MIEGIKVRLRVLELEDTETIYNNFNSIELRIYLSNRTSKSIEDERQFIKSS